MKTYNVINLSNGNDLLIYKSEDGIAELYYHDYSSDTDTFICEVSDEDICNLCD
jgi:hypothetical protein|nr:MAG TPA: hypothetical protein [Caudoviricetes sp.]